MRDGVSNYQPHDCLLNRLFRHKSKKTSKLRVTDLCDGNSPETGGSPHKWPGTWKMFPFNDVIMETNILSFIDNEMSFCHFDEIKVTGCTEIVILTTFGAVIGDNFFKMTVFPFQRWLHVVLHISYQLTLWVPVLSTIITCTWVNIKLDVIFSKFPSYFWFQTHFRQSLAIIQDGREDLAKYRGISIFKRRFHNNEWSNIAQGEWCSKSYLLAGGQTLTRQGGKYEFMNKTNASVGYDINSLRPSDACMRQ